MASTSPLLEVSSFERISGQSTTSKSPTRSDSTVDSALEPVFESPPLRESPFKSAFDTPQSSVVNIVLIRPAQQARVARFVECACVSGGLCVGAGDGAACDCDVVAPQVPDRKTKAEKVKRLGKKARCSFSKAVKKLWKSCKDL